MDIETLTEQVAQVSESYARTFGFVRSDDWYLLKLQEEVGELTQSYLKLSGRARVTRDNRDNERLKAAFTEELADVVCHALLAANHFGVDMTEVIREKWLSKLEAPSPPEDSRTRAEP